MSDLTAQAHFVDGEILSALAQEYGWRIDVGGMNPNTVWVVRVKPKDEARYRAAWASLFEEGDDQMRAACYVRVSTDKQVEKYSLPAQRKILTEYCERQGWEPVVYEDAGISGETIAARPAMIRLLKDAAARKFEVALAVEIERFSRSKDLFDWLTLQKVFGEAGVRFGTPAQQFDPADVEDAFLSVLFGALSSREKQKFMERTRRGKMEASRQGRYVSAHAPYGYRLAGKGQGALVIHEEEARTVRRIFEEALAGRGTRTIARTLTEQGIPSPRRRSKIWRWSTVRRILTHEVYIGKAFYNQRKRVSKTVLRFRPESEWVAVSVPRIVSDDTFRRAGEQLKRNQVMSPRNQRYPYLLKGLVKCGLCGRGRAPRRVPGIFLGQTYHEVTPNAAGFRFMSDTALARHSFFISSGDFTRAAGSKLATSWLHGYWLVGQGFVERQQTRFPARYGDAAWLHNALLPIEQRKRGTLDNEEWSDFLSEERARKYPCLSLQRLW